MVAEIIISASPVQRKCTNGVSREPNNEPGNFLRAEPGNVKCPSLAAGRLSDGGTDHGPNPSVGWHNAVAKCTLFSRTASWVVGLVEGASAIPL